MSDNIFISGEVISDDGNAIFRIGNMRYIEFNKKRMKIEDDMGEFGESDTLLLAHISGKIRTNNITISVGDTVVAEVSPYDMTRCRIIYRADTRK
jgi:hypothetical protein